MTHMNITLTRALARPHAAPPCLRPVMQRFALGFVAASALLIGCAGAVESDPTGEVVQKFSAYPTTFVASLPSSTDSRPAIAASIGWPGNIEAVRTTANGALEHMYWAPGLATWVPTATFGSNVASEPGLCVYSPDGFMQVVVLEAGSNGQLRHYWRNNSDQAWTQEGLFSQNCAGSPAVINNREIPANLEVVVREDRHLKHIWRDANYAWQNETVFAFNANVIGDPSLVQTADGRLHVLAARYLNDRIVIGHWTRDQNVWSYVGEVSSQSGSGVATALVADDRDNSLEAIIQDAQCGPNTIRLGLYRFNGAQWVSNGTLGGGCPSDPTQDCSRAALYPSATTLNGNELHTVFFSGDLQSYQHWKLQ